MEIVLSHILDEREQVLVTDKMDFCSVEQKLLDTGRLGVGGEPTLDLLNNDAIRTLGVDIVNSEDNFYLNDGVDDVLANGSVMRLAEDLSKSSATESSVDLTQNSSDLEPRSGSTWSMSDNNVIDDVVGNRSLQSRDLTGCVQEWLVSQMNENEMSDFRSEMKKLCCVTVGSENAVEPLMTVSDGHVIMNDDMPTRGAGSSDLNSTLASSLTGGDPCLCVFGFRAVNSMERPTPLWTDHPRADMVVASVTRDELPVVGGGERSDVRSAKKVYVHDDEDDGMVNTHDEGHHVCPVPGICSKLLESVEQNDYADTNTMSFTIPERRILPEAVLDNQRKCTEGSDTSIPFRDKTNRFYIDGYVFNFKESFIFYWVAKCSGQRLYQSLALGLLTVVDVKNWNDKLQSVLKQKEISPITQRLWVNQAKELWECECPPVVTQTDSTQTVTGTGKTSQCTVEPGLSTNRLDNPIPQGDPDNEVRNVLSTGFDESRDTQYVSVVTQTSTVRHVPRGLMMRVMGRIGTYNVIALNDSGADVSVISARTAKHLELDIMTDVNSLRVCNPDGSPFTIVGVVQTQISFMEGTASFGLSAIVLKELKEDLILGDDFLSKHEAILAYGSAFVQYGNLPVPVLDQVKFNDNDYRATDGCAVSIGLHDVVVKKGSRMEIVGKVCMPVGFRYRQYAWEFEPLAAAEQIFNLKIAPSIVRLHDVNTVVAIVVVNAGLISDTIIPANSILGTLRVLRGLGSEKIETGLTVVHRIGTPVSVNFSPTNPSKREAEFLDQLRTVLSGVPEDVTPQQKGDLERLLREFQKTLCSDVLGEANVFTFDIDPGSSRPVCHSERRYSPKEQLAIKAQIDALVADGLIEPANSQWSSRLVCAPKKDDEGGKTDVRVCVDFRDVNRLCVKDAYPAPNIEATLDMLHKATWYTSLDLEKGYHQVPLTERAKQICAFRCPFGFFRYKRLPFGIMNAPAAFQRMMDLVLAGLTWTSAMVYMDDVVVFSTTWADHMTHLREVLNRISTAGLTCKFKKCQFGKREIMFLGYYVSKEGIKPDKGKVSAVREFRVPTCLAEVRSFLGLAGVFRKFILGYGDIARPLQRTVRKDMATKWRDGKAWTSECQEAFEALKIIIAQEVVLAHPRYDRPLILVCDASGYGMGAMLAQEDDEGVERPVAFASASFKKEALNYTTTEKEGLAVVWAVKHFRPYLHGIPTIVVTDHAALTWIFTRGDPPPRISHWVMDLAEYDLTFVHRKGSHNVVADALSRLKRTMSATVEQDEVDGSSIEHEPLILRVISTWKLRSRDLRKETKESRGVHADIATGDGVSVVDIADVDEAQITDTGMSITQLKEVARSEKLKKVSSRIHDDSLQDFSSMGATDTSPRNHSPQRNGPTYEVLQRDNGASWMECPDSISPQALVDEQLKESEWRAMFEWLMNGTTPYEEAMERWVAARHDEYAVQGGVLKKIEIVPRGKASVIRLVIVVPTVLRRGIMDAYHNHPAIGGHMDAIRTYARIKQHFWWPRLCSDVLDYVGSCLTCRVHQTRTAGPAPIQQNAQATRPFQIVAVDLMAMPVSKNANKYVLVLVDYFSRYVIVAAIPDKKASTIAKTLMERLVLIHGHPDKLHSDLGGEFQNKILLDMCTALTTKKTFTTAYRPQADGVVERFNRTLLKLLGCYVSKEQDDWDVVLPYVVFAYNTAVSRVTGCAPFSVIYGREAPSAIYARVLSETGQLSNASDAVTWSKQVAKYMDDEFGPILMQEATEKKDRERAAINSKRKQVIHLVPGTIVMRHNKKALLEGAKLKLASKQRGMYVVVEHVSDVNVRLRKVADSKEHMSVVHVDNVEPIKGTRRKFLVTMDVHYPGSSADDGVEEDEPESDETTFEVESVVGFRLSDGKIEFKLHWKGFGKEYDLWVHEGKMDCTAKVEAFLELQGDSLLRTI